MGISGITMKLTVNRFCINANKALKFGAKTVGKERWREKLPFYSSDWYECNFFGFVIYFIHVDTTGGWTA